VITPRIEEAVGKYYREGDLICTVEDPAVMQAQIAIAEDDSPPVQVGQTVQLKFRALPFQVFHAQVEKIAVAATCAEETDPEKETKPGQTQRMILVSCRVDDPHGQLRTGMSGYARISLSQASIASIVANRTLRFVRTEFWW
jgi:hypothetical protein